ncbi:MAG: DUF2807 domain-containing protein [Bacteroidales bacterium]|nr:DUF2807 domain-containing protein [Bacteroidales bacterium]
MITQERQLSDISKVVLYDNINLNIIPDSLDFLVINCPENLINFITSDNSNKILTLSNKNKCNWLRSYDYQINTDLHTSSLSELEYRGSGSISNKGLWETPRFEINVFEGTNTINMNLSADNVVVKLHNGQADMYLNGRAGEALVYNAGEGYIFMQNFNSDNCDIRHKGTGDCHVNVSETLDASLEYVGNIHYYGNPEEINTQLSGSGKFIKH